MLVLQERVRLPILEQEQCKPRNLPVLRRQVCIHYGRRQTRIALPRKRAPEEHDLRQRIFIRALPIARRIHIRHHCRIVREARTDDVQIALYRRRLGIRIPRNVSRNRQGIEPVDGSRLDIVIEIHASARRIQWVNQDTPPGVTASCTTTCPEGVSGPLGTRSGGTVPCNLAAHSEALPGSPNTPASDQPAALPTAMEMRVAYGSRSITS